MREKSNENHTTGTGAYRFGEFDLYRAERQLHLRQQPVRLSPKVFDALLLFVGNAERLVRRDQLIETLWPDTFVTDATLTNVIVSLRKILGHDAIQTVSKSGYRFCLHVVGEPGIDHTTYATFVRAKELATFKSLDSMSQARDLFSVCVAAEPGFAAAWAWLGRCARFLDKFKGGSSANLELAQAAFRRSLAIDPHQASAHQFYTQLQVELGDARGAMERLARRVVTRGDDPESYAGLVHACRHCGLLDESIAAHGRAIALDPTIVTSVPHTHFLRGDYEATIETQTVGRYYMDAASWAALGSTARAVTLLQERLSPGSLSVQMSALLGSLLATLERRHDEAAALMRNADVHHEPEILFYFARHYAMIGDQAEMLATLQRARREGFTSSYALAHDRVFEPFRARAKLEQETAEARRLEISARRALDETGATDRLKRAETRSAQRA